MTPDIDFWKLLADCTGDSGLDLEQLDRRLSVLALAERSRLHDCLRALLQQAETDSVYQAGSLLAGSWLGDDGFAAFRRGLIALGADDFQQLLAHPDDLAEILERRTVPLAIESVWVEDLGEIEQGEHRTPFDEREDGFACASFDLLASHFPKLWSRLGARFVDPVDLPEEAIESFDVPGLGVVTVGDHLRHHNYGACKVLALVSSMSPTMRLAFAEKVETMLVTPENFSRLH